MAAGSIHVVFRAWPSGSAAAVLHEIAVGFPPRLLSVLTTAEQ